MLAHQVPQYIASQGKKLRTGLDTILQQEDISFLHCRGLDCRTMLTIDPAINNPLALKSLLQQEFFKRGILWSGFHTLSYSHTDKDIDYTLKSYREILIYAKRAVQEDIVQSSLCGEVVEPVFRKTSNFHTKPKTETDGKK